MLLGTFTTIDCPTQNKDEARHWLVEQFKKVGGIVREIDNPHDLGSYPSFEIDYPLDLENVEEDDGVENYIKEEWLRKEEWQNKANEIVEDYYKKFEQYL